MADIQIPDFVGHNLQRDQFNQNALALRSRLATEELQRQGISGQNEQMGMVNQNLQEATAKRHELIQVMQSSDNPERAAYEWSKRNDPEHYAALTKMYFDKMKDQWDIDPEGAVARLNMRTGENIKVVPGKKDFIDIKTDEGTVLYNVKTGEQTKIGGPKRLIVPKGAGVLFGEETTPSYTQPDTEKAGTPYGDFTSGDPEKKKLAEQYLARNKDPETEDLKKLLLRMSVNEKKLGLVDSADITSAAGAIVAGKMSPSQLSAYGRSKLRGQIMAKVFELDPEFDVMKAEAGVVAGNRNQKLIRSLDAVDLGLNTVLKTSKKFSRSEVGLLNNIILKGEVQINDKRAIRFQTAIQAVIDDLASALSGGGATTDQARNQARSIFNSSYSQGGLEAAIGSVREVIDSRRAAFSAGTTYDKGRRRSTDIVGPKILSIERVE